MNLTNIKLPAGSLTPTPQLVSMPDIKTSRITNAIDNLQNMNRLRDMDNLSYQIKLKEQQKDICERRLKSINSTIDIRAGRIISILIIICNVIIPFLIVAFQDLLDSLKFYIFVYLIVSFVLSMLSMSIYLFLFWKK